MKKIPALFILLFFFHTFFSYSQHKIVFKDKPDTVFCKITKVTTTNIFYIEKKEYKSDYMRNVVYHSEMTTINSNTANKKEGTQNKEVKTQKEVTTKSESNTNKEPAAKKEVTAKNEPPANKEVAVKKEVTAKNESPAKKESATQKEVTVQSSDVITIKQNTTQILSIIKFRDKNPITPDGYDLYTVYTLPATGFIPLFAVEPTFYVYKKK